MAIFANTAVETHDVVDATAFIRKAVCIAEAMSGGLFDNAVIEAQMPAIPSNMQHYRTTRMFTAATVPDALRQAHRTAAGVFGRIVMSKGRLLYTIGSEQSHVL